MGNEDLFNAFNDTFLDGGTSSNSSYFGVDSSGNSPLNFGMLAPALKAGGSVLGAFGYLQQGKNIAQANEYNAMLTSDIGDYKISSLEKEGDLLASTQKTVYAKAGVTMSGSPLDAMLQSATNIELDKQVVNYNTQSKVDMYNYTARQAQAQAKFKAGETLLSGAGSLALALL